MVCIALLMINTMAGCIVVSTETRVPAIGRFSISGWPFILNKMGRREEAFKYYDKVMHAIQDDCLIPEQVFENDIQKAVSTLCWNHVMFIFAPGNSDSWSFKVHHGGYRDSNQRLWPHRPDCYPYRRDTRQTLTIPIFAACTSWFWTRRKMYRNCDRTLQDNLSLTSEWGAVLSMTVLEVAFALAMTSGSGAVCMGRKELLSAQGNQFGMPQFV